jgi:hypothetical protein
VIMLLIEVGKLQRMKVHFLFQLVQRCLYNYRQPVRSCFVAVYNLRIGYFHIHYHYPIGSTGLEVQTFFKNVQNFKIWNFFFQFLRSPRSVPLGRFNFTRYYPPSFPPSAALISFVDRKNRVTFIQCVYRVPQSSTQRSENYC